MTTEYHIPVFSNEAVDYLVTTADGLYVDATLGGGGHSELIAERLSANGRLLGIDADDDALLAATKRLERFPYTVFAKENFCNLRAVFEQQSINAINGIVFDLGVSSHQFDDVERGFSYRGGARLDFRMNREQELDGYIVVNEYDEKQLADIFFYYGEERHSRRIAKRLIEQRVHKPVETTEDLKKIVHDCIGGKFLNKSLARVFQAIRIEVNDELENLKRGLATAVEFLAPEGRIVVISYHSLEDRIVKHYFQSLAKAETPLVHILTKKPLIPSDDEISTNPRARSAKMRVAEKI